jgi:hypothetical protein
VNPLGTQLIRAGQMLVLVSLQTGLYFRLDAYTAGNEPLVVRSPPPASASVLQPPSPRGRSTRGPPAAVRASAATAKFQGTHCRRCTHPCRSLSPQWRQQ